MAGALKTSKGQSYQLPVEDEADRENPKLEVLMYGKEGVGKSAIVALWADLEGVDYSRKEFTFSDAEQNGTIHLKLFSEDQRSEFREQLPQADAVVFVYDTTPISLECIDLMWKSVRSEMHVNQFILVLKNRDDSCIQTKEDRNFVFSLPVDSLFFRLPIIVEEDDRTFEAAHAAVIAARSQLFVKTYRCHTKNRHTPQTLRLQSPGLQSMSVVYGIGLRRTDENHENREAVQENQGQKERKKSKLFHCFSCCGTTHEDND